MQTMTSEVHGYARDLETAGVTTHHLFLLQYENISLSSFGQAPSGSDSGRTGAQNCYFRFRHFYTTNGMNLLVSRQYLPYPESSRTNIFSSVIALIITTGAKIKTPRTNQEFIANSSPKSNNRSPV